MEKNEENAKATEDTQEPPIKKKSVYLPKSAAFGEYISSNLAKLTTPIVLRVPKEHILRRVHTGHPMRIEPD